MLKNSFLFANSILTRDSNRVLQTKKGYARKNLYFISNRYISTLVPKDIITGKIEPNYISGLVQADGSFFCGTSVNKTGDGIVFHPKFEIAMDTSSAYVLKAIKEQLHGVGDVEPRKSEHCSHYVVSKQSEINDVIIPFFKEHPVYFNKLHAFELLVKIMAELKRKQNRDNLNLLLMALSMNKNTSRSEAQINRLFNVYGLTDSGYRIPDTHVQLQNKIDIDFFAGLIDGDGTFNISFSGDGQIIPQFGYVLGPTCIPIYDESIKYFGVANPEIHTNYIVYKIRAYEDLIHKVITFFLEHKIHTTKRTHFEIWSKVCLMVYENGNGYFTKSELLEIVELAYNMNLGGKRRRYTKAEYIERMNLFYVNNLHIKSKKH